MCFTLKCQAAFLCLSSYEEFNFLGQASMGIKNDLQKKKKNSLCKKILPLKDPTLLKTNIGNSFDFLLIEISFFLLKMLLIPFITYTMITGT